MILQHWSDFRHLQVLANEVQTRTFLAACPVAQPASWQQAVRSTDAVLLKHRLRPYFDEPKLHVSLCWWHGNQTDAISWHLATLQALWDSDVGSLHVQVHDVPLHNTRICMGISVQAFFAHERQESQVRRAVLYSVLCSAVHV